MKQFNDLAQAEKDLIQKALRIVQALSRQEAAKDEKQESWARGVLTMALTSLTGRDRFISSA